MVLILLLIALNLLGVSVEKRKALKRAGSAKGQKTLVFIKVLLDDVVEVIPPSKLVYVFFSNLAIKILNQTLLLFAPPFPRKRGL